MKKNLIWLVIVAAAFIAISHKTQDKIMRKEELVTIYKDRLGYEYIKFNNTMKKNYIYDILIENYTDIGKEYVVSLRKNTHHKIYYFTGSSGWLDMPASKEGLYEFKKVLDDDTYIGFSISNDMDNLYICSVNGYIKRGKMTNEMKNVYMDTGMYIAEYSFDIETDYAIKHCFLVVQIDSFEKYRMIWAL